MGSPLGPVLANIFMRKFEENVIAQHQGPKPTFYRRYVDDIISIFEDMSQVNPFFDFMNSLHENIKFTKEVETFLDITYHESQQHFRYEHLLCSTHPHWSLY